MDDKKIVGRGNTACVYEWDEDRVIKLFYPGFSEEAIRTEYLNASAINSLNFKQPKVYELSSYGERKGIIYEKVEGESLLEWIERTVDLEQSAKCLASIHKTIVNNTMSDLPSYKQLLKYWIERASFSKDKESELFEKINALEDGDTLCHGDFHPGNIILSEKGDYVIDFMCICKGNAIYDIARTVYLMEYTPLPENVEDKEGFTKLRTTLVDRYLYHMNVDRDRIQDYLYIVSEARKGECPNEFSEHL